MAMQDVTKAILTLLPYISVAGTGASIAAAVSDKDKRSQAAVKGALIALSGALVHSNSNKLIDKSLNKIYGNKYRDVKAAHSLGDPVKSKQYLLDRGYKKEEFKKLYNILVTGGAVEHFAPMGLGLGTSTATAYVFKNKEKEKTAEKKDNTVRNTAIAGAIGGSVGGLASHAVKRVNDHFNKEDIDSFGSKERESKVYSNTASDELKDDIGRAKDSKYKALKQFKQRHSYYKNPKYNRLSKAEVRYKIRSDLKEARIDHNSIKSSIEHRDNTRDFHIKSKKSLSDLHDEIKTKDAKNIFIKKKYMIPAAALAAAGSYLVLRKNDSNKKK